MINTHSSSIILHFETPLTVIFLKASCKPGSSVLTASIAMGSVTGTPSSFMPLAKYGTNAWALDLMHSLSVALHGLMTDTMEKFKQ